MEGHLKKQVGFQTPLMADGNYARRLTEDRTVAALCEMVKSDARKDAIKELVDLYRLLRSVWSSNNPHLYPDLVRRYDANAEAFCKVLREKFPYFTTLPNYLHKMTVDNTLRHFVQCMSDIAASLYYWFVVH